VRLEKLQRSNILKVLVAPSLEIDERSSRDNTPIVPDGIALPTVAVPTKHLQILDCVWPAEAQGDYVVSAQALRRATPQTHTPARIH
jgi:hypothetical protein